MMLGMKVGICVWVGINPYSVCYLAARTGWCSTGDCSARVVLLYLGLVVCSQLCTKHEMNSTDFVPRNPYFAALVGW